MNLGREDRHFLFINRSVGEILRLLGERYRGVHPTELVRRFLEQSPGYPALKVRVAPGEAYLAPTENLIHDGCALEKRFPDIQLTVRGYMGI